MTPPPSDQQRDLEGLREAVTLHEDYERIDRIEAALERANGEAERAWEFEHKMMERATEAEEKLEDAEAALERAARVEEATRAYIQARRDRLPTRWPELLAALDALAPPQEGASG